MANKKSIFLVLASFICSVVICTSGHASQKTLQWQEVRMNKEIPEISKEEKILGEEVQEKPCKTAELYNKASDVRVEGSQWRAHNEQAKGSYGFYVGINVGKVFYDNSQDCLQGVNNVVDKMKEYAYSFVPESFTSYFEKMIPDEIKNIAVNKDINFQSVASASLGYYSRSNAGAAFEAIYSKVEIHDSSRNSVFDKQAGMFTFLFNLYYSPSIKNTSFSPYVGMGIGPTLIRLKKIALETALNIPWVAYQAQAGIEYSITPGIEAFLGYRYFGVPVPLINDNIATSSIEAGLLFKF